MIKRRDLATAIILSIVTCGIYSIYWFVKLTDEVNFVTGNAHSTSGGVAFLLTLVTCGIYGFYWAYDMGNKLDNCYMARGMASGSRSVIYLVLNIFGLSIVTYALIQDSVNKLI